MMLAFLSMSLGGARKSNIEALHTCKFYVSKHVCKTTGPRDLQIGCYGNQGHLPPPKYPDDDRGGGLI